MDLHSRNYRGYVPPNVRDEKKRKIWGPKK
jgi:hypothetical protein